MPADPDEDRILSPEVEPDDADVIEPATTAEPMPEFVPDDTDPAPDEGPVPDMEA